MIAPFKFAAGSFEAAPPYDRLRDRLLDLPLPGYGLVRDAVCINVVVASVALEPPAVSFK